MHDTHRRHLELAAAGKQAQLDWPARTTAGIIFAALADRGLVRLVHHRDYTRTYTLTPTGRAMLHGAARGT